MFSKFFKSLSPSKKIAFTAVLLALSVVANTVIDFDPNPNNKITITYFVCFMSAYLLGAVPAFAVAFVGDFIGWLIMPDGMYWLYGLTLGIFAFITGVFLHCLPLKGGKSIYIKSIIALVAGYVAVTLFLNTIVNYTYVWLFVWNGELKKTFFVYIAASIIPRLGLQTAVYAGNIALCFAVIPVFERLLPRLTKKKEREPDEEE